MSGRTTILGILRRRRAGAGRLVLAWFALAAASVGAAPCFAMMAAPGAQRAPAHQHGHGSPSASAEHHHAPGAGHDHSAPTAEPESPAPDPCPHCPVTVSMAGHASTASHSFCSAADDVSDGAKPTVPTIPFKLVLSVPIVELLPFDPGPSLAREQQRPRDADVPSVALNLCHCVFLI